jgi:hypothetical protein
MGRESSMRPNYEILAFITMDKNRYLGGKALSILAQSDKELTQVTRDIAVAMKADVIKLSTGDYMVIRV